MEKNIKKNIYIYIYMCVCVNNWVTSLYSRNQHKFVSQAFLGGAVSGTPFANAGDRGQSLVLEDSVCPRATKIMRHSYWSHALESGSCNYGASVM